jgi:amino acid transporter
MNSSSLISLGAALATPYSSFGIATIVLVGVGITVILGTRVHFRLQNLVFFIGILGTIAIIGVLLGSTPAQFLASFNKYTAPYSQVSDSYNSVIKSATGLGFTTAPFSWYATLVGTTAAFASVAFANFSTYCSGEMKQGTKVGRQIVAMIGSMFFNAILSLIVANLIVGVAGSQFVGAAYYLSTFSPQSWPFPVAPFLNLYVAMLTENAVVNAISAAAWMAWGIAIVMILFIFMTRVLFAWSFDRLIPKFFADVSDRFHTMVKGTIAVIIVGEVFLFIMAWLPPAFLGYLGYALAASVLPTALLVSISGIVFPYRARTIYQASSISKLRIGPVPLITVTGLVSTAFVLMLTYFYLTDSALGVNTPQVLAIIAAAIIISVILYGVIKIARKREGLDLSLSFKEIPPE